MKLRILATLTLLLIAALALAQQSVFDKVHERGVAIEKRLAQTHQGYAIKVGEVADVAKAQPIKVSAEDALKLRELQVKQLNTQNQIAQMKLAINGLEREVQQTEGEINQGIAALFTKAKVKQEDYTLDASKWELVPKEAKK